MYSAKRTTVRLNEFDKLTETFPGDIVDLERAIGAYYVGRRLGWRIMYVVHDKKTLRKYEEILGIEFRAEFEEYEDQATRTVAYKAIQLVTNFWKAVKGEIPFKRSTMFANSRGN